LRPRLRRVQSARKREQVIGFWSASDRDGIERSERGKSVIDLGATRAESPVKSERAGASDRLREKESGGRSESQNGKHGGGVHASRIKALATGAGRVPLQDGGAKGCIVEQVQWWEMVHSGAKYCLVVSLLGARKTPNCGSKKSSAQTLPFDQQWITAKGVTEMKSAGGSIVAGFFVSMAAIPILMGLLIFAPIFIPLALICVVLESSRE
jgi:hypothetical protein